MSFQGKKHFHLKKREKQQNGGNYGFRELKEE
jgi:hypothetical protein